ncbi:MAG TPA: hypothetical protein VMY40_02920, partial [Anaerolineae bacterium]|nr:hypothetical protein [Anaerolineae bacterium]
MSRRTQRNDSTLIVTMKRFLGVAAAVCLLATLANRAIALPVQAASAAAESPAPTSPSPTPTTATGWLRPS